MTTHSDGQTTITAELIVTVGEGGDAHPLTISTASYKLKVGNSDFGFIPRDIYCEYGDDNPVSNVVHKYYLSEADGTTDLGLFNGLESREPTYGWGGVTVSRNENESNRMTGLRLKSQAPRGGGPNSPEDWYFEVANSNENGKVNGKITALSLPQYNTHFRAGMQLIDYDQKVPKYTKLSVSMNYAITSVTETDNGNTSLSAHGGALFDFGQVRMASVDSDDDEVGDKTWPHNDSKDVFSITTNRKNDDPGHNGDNKFIARRFEGTQENRNGSEPYVFTFDNSTASQENKMREKLGALSFVDYYSETILFQTYTYNKIQTGTFTYSNRALKYDYYATVSFNANGGSGSMTAQNDHAIGEAGTFTLNSINESTIKRDGYTFIGWNTEADGSGTSYADADEFCPFDNDDDNGGGKGPVTLYAQWKQIPVVDDDPSHLDPDVTPILVYSLWGNGGTIEEGGEKKDAIADIYATGQTVPNPVTTATRPGYTFLGYYTSTTGGLQVFNASGVPVYANGYTAYASDGTTLKWTSEEESLELYAQWELITNPGDPNYVTPHNLTLKYNYTSSPTDVVLQVMNGSGQNNQVTSYNPPARDGYIFTGWYVDEAEANSWEDFRALYTTSTTATNVTASDGKRYNRTGGTGGGGTPWENAPHDLKINPANSVLVYNANGESVKLVGYTNDPDYGEIPTYEAVNSAYFNANGIHQKNEDIILYAHWLDTNSKISFHEGTTTASSAKYKTGNSTLAALTSSTLNTASEMDDEGANKRAYEEIEFGEVMISRGFKESDWNTICFPCYVSEEQVNLLFEKVMIYSKLEYENNSATMKFRASKAITPGAPYFVKLKSGYSTSSSNAAWIIKDTEGLYVFHFKNAEVNQMKTTISYTAKDESNNSCTVAMVGELDTKLHIGEGAVDASTTEYLYLQNDQFFVSGGTYNVGGINKTVWGNNKGFRCYFTRPKDSAGDAKAFTLKLDLEGYDGWTGEDAIEDINAEGVYSAGGGDIYDLSGRQLMGKPQRGLYIVNGRKYISK